MQESIISYLDGEIKLTEQEPSSLEEILLLFPGDEKEKNETLIEKLNSHLRNSSKYARVYAKVSEQLTAKGFPKEVKSETTLSDGTIKKIHASNIEHIRAYWYQKETTVDGKKVLDPADSEACKMRQAEVLQMFTEVAASEPLYVESEGRGGVGKLAQTNIDFANLLVGKGEAAVEAVVKFLETQSGLVAGRNAQNEVTVESLARLKQGFDQFVKRKAEKEAAELIALAQTGV